MWWHFEADNEVISTSGPLESQTRLLAKHEIKHKPFVEIDVLKNIL